MSSKNAPQPIYIITGVMAAGKSTIGQLLAERLERSVHLRGDAFRRMVVNGRVEMSANPSDEALRQLKLRYQAAAQTAKLYSSSGFSVVYQDTVIGPLLADVVAMYREFPVYLIVLCPDAQVIAQRERRRQKTGYHTVTIEDLQAALDETPRLGLWLDSSKQTPEETTTVILNSLQEAEINSVNRNRMDNTL